MPVLAFAAAANAKTGKKRSSPTRRRGAGGKPSAFWRVGTGVIKKPLLFGHSKRSPTNLWGKISPQGAGPGVGCTVFSPIRLIKVVVGYNRPVRKFLLALALLLGVLFLIGRFAEMQNILEIIGHGKVGFILLALLAEAAWIFVVGLTYQAIYIRLGMQVGVWHMVRVASAANFLNIIAPAGGLSSVALFISTAKGSGHSTARATVASVCLLYTSPSPRD